MANYYGIAYARFWTGPTGRALRRRGGKDAQLLAAYLLFNEHMNMLGLYELRLAHVREELQLTAPAIRTAFAITADEQYAFYDPETEFVWVREMARFRLSITDDRPLARDDKKAIGARRLYESLPSNPWLGPFFDRYAKLIGLKDRREGASKGLRSGIEGASTQDVAAKGRRATKQEAASEGLRRGLEGASKGLRRGFEASKQIRSGTGSGTERTSSPPAADDSPADNLNVITKLAHEAIDNRGPDDPDLVETVKDMCARLHVAYSSTVVRKAVESALVQREVRA